MMWQYITRRKFDFYGQYMEKENKKGVNLLGTAVMMGVITVFAKFLGLLRDILVARAYGTGIEAVAYDRYSR